MRIFVLIAALVLPLPAAAQQACSNFELVGFTSSMHLGNEGVLELTLACQNDYVDSRMCTSVEVMQTVNVPGGLSGDAWVRPVFVPNGGASGTADASGTTTTSPFSLTCGGWAGISSFGLSVNSNGGFNTESGNCNTTPLAIACCAAAPGNMAMLVPVSSVAGRMLLVVLMLGAVGMYWTRRAEAQ